MSLLKGVIRSKPEILRREPNLDLRNALDRLPDPMITPCGLITPWGLSEILCVSRTLEPVNNSV